MNKNIVILGGGTGGIITANKLRQSLSNEHRIIIVEKNIQHAFAPSFPWLMVGYRKPEQITRDLHRIVRSGIGIINSEIKSIDIQSSKVITNDSTLKYDYLVIALGAELAPELVNGFNNDIDTFYTFNGAKKLGDTLRTFEKGNICIVVSSMPYKCPGAPHEVSMLLSNFFKKRGVEKNVNIHIFTPEPQPMPVAGPELGNAIKQMLESYRVSFHPLHKLTSIDKSNKQLYFDANESFKYDLVMLIPPHRAPKVVKNAGLTNESGWIPVDRATLKTKHNNVYAIGDITSISIPGRWKQDVPLNLPKAGVFSHIHGEVVADRIANEIKGNVATETFCGDGYCVLEAGSGMAGFAYGNFFTEPSPQVRMYSPGKSWHLGRVMFEKWWLSSFGLKKTLLRTALNLGSKITGTPVKI